ncbi:hypothetical protein DMENIID0001_166120 [Sergentomyia squamirostris]
MGNLLSVLIGCVGAVELITLLHQITTRAELEYERLRLAESGFNAPGEIDSLLPEINFQEYDHSPNSEVNPVPFVDGLKQRPLVRDDGTGRRRAFKKRNSSGSLDPENKLSREEELRMFTSLEEEEFKKIAQEEYVPISYNSESGLKVRKHQKKHRRSPINENHPESVEGDTEPEDTEDEVTYPWGDINPEHHQTMLRHQREKTRSIGELTEEDEKLGSSVESNQDWKKSAANKTAKEGNPDVTVSSAKWKDPGEFDGAPRSFACNDEHSVPEQIQERISGQDPEHKIDLEKIADHIFEKISEQSLEEIPEQDLQRTFEQIAEEMDGKFSEEPRERTPRTPENQFEQQSVETHVVEDLNETKVEEWLHHGHIRDTYSPTITLTRSKRCLQMDSMDVHDGDTTSDTTTDFTPEDIVLVESVDTSLVSVNHSDDSYSYLELTSDDKEEIFLTLKPQDRKSPSPHYATEEFIQNERELEEESILSGEEEIEDFDDIVNALKKNVAREDLKIEDQEAQSDIFTISPENVDEAERAEKEEDSMSFPKKLQAVFNEFPLENMIPYGVDTSSDRSRCEILEQIKRENRRRQKNAGPDRYFAPRPSLVDFPTKLEMSNANLQEELKVFPLENINDAHFFPTNITKVRYAPTIQVHHVELKPISIIDRKSVSPGRGNLRIADRDDPFMDLLKDRMFPY